MTVEVELKYKLVGLNRQTSIADMENVVKTTYGYRFKSEVSVEEYSRRGNDVEVRLVVKGDMKEIRDGAEEVEFYLARLCTDLQ